MQDAPIIGKIKILFSNMFIHELVYRYYIHYSIQSALAI